MNATATSPSVRAGVRDLALRLAVAGVLAGLTVTGAGLLHDTDIWTVSTVAFSAALFAGWVAFTLLGPRPLPVYPRWGPPPEHLLRTTRIHITHRH